MKKKKQFDFLGIGVMKSGTTWLYKNLEKVPEFSLLPIKELHYFDRSTDYASPNKLAETNVFNRIRQKNYLSSSYYTIKDKTGGFRDWKLVKFYLKWFFSNYTDKWYMSLFKYGTGYTGEVTPSYSILNKEDIKRIHNLNPDARLVLILRNPIERAWSHYRFHTRRIKDFNFDNVTNKDIIAFLEKEAQTVRSDYIRAIDNFTSVFNKEQLLICFYDAIQENPEKLFSNIITHICGDAHVSISHLNLKEVVFKSRTIDRPKEIDDYLKDRYHDQLKELSERYGGYFTKWYSDSYPDKASNPNTALSPSMIIEG